MTTEFPKGDLFRDTQVTPHPDRPHSYVGNIGEAWQLIHAFGGVTLAVGLRAIEAQVNSPRLKPLYVSALFSSPVPCGAVRVDVETLSESNSVHQAAARLYSEDEASPNVHLQATFGKPIQGKRTLREAQFPKGILPAADSFPNGPSPLDAFPNVHQFEMRWAHDFCTRPGKPAPAEPIASEPADVCSWIRYHNPPKRADGTIDPVTLCAPADFMAAALFRGLGTDAQPFFPVTLAMDIQFFGTTQREWLLQRVRVWNLTDGFACGVLELWDEDENLLAISTQRRICKGMPSLP
jgi:acyl-CoA thioesterase